MGKAMDPDTVWVVAEPHEDLALGEEVSLGEGPVRGDRGLFEWRPGKFVLVMKQRRENVEDFKKVRVAECAGMADPGHSTFAVEVNAAKHVTLRGKDNKDAWTKPGTDDEQGEQGRVWKQVIWGSSENFLEDWPFEGPRTTPWMMNNPWSGGAQTAECVAAARTGRFVACLKDSSEIEKEKQKAAGVRGLEKNPHSPPGHAAGKK
jgi:hypothetical protein